MSKRTWMRTWGLRRRLVAITVLAAAVAVAVLVIGLQVLLARQANSQSIAALRSRADAAAATVRFGPNETRVLETPAASFDQNIWIFDDSGIRIDGLTPPREVDEEVARLSDSSAERSVDVRGHFRVLARPVLDVHDSTRRAVVVAALDLSPYESAERRTLWASLALELLAIVAARAASWFGSGTALRQVRGMARRANEHDLSGRFDLGPVRDELSELAATLDRMLDRITQAILAERRLTDEVAHELRTPLAVIRAEAQLAQLQHTPDGAGESDGSLTFIVAAVDRMNASIDTMLVVARSPQTEDDSCKAGDLLFDLGAHGTAPSDAVRDVSGGTTRQDLAVVVEPASPDLVIGAPLRVVTAAATPLLDNAVRHARTRVRVRITSDDRQVVLHIEDDGPGIREGEVQDVFEPGRSTVPNGAGLGLSLSRRLAHAAGGQVAAVPGAVGHFTLCLPRR
jgi:two-component system, OmpR family, sensor kinase